MSTWKLAWRNIWRNRRRTLVTIAAMTLAVFLTIGYAGLVDGMLVQMQSDTLDFETGAVQIFAPGYQDRPSIYTGIADTPAILQRLDAAGIEATPRLIGAGLVAAGDSSAGAVFYGVDLTREPRVLALAQQVWHGQWLDAAGGKGVVIGRKLAHTLGVKPGDELVVLSQAIDGSMANELFSVRGVLKTVSEGIDRGGLFMAEASFRGLLGYGGGAHQLIIKRPAVLDTTALKAQVAAAAPGQDVQSWRDLNPMVATMLDSVAGLISIFFLIANLAIGIVVLNAMLMAVFERIKEFGVLKALGVGPGGVLKLIYVESLLQVTIAAIAGALLSLPMMWFLSTTGLDMGALGGTSVMGMSMMTTWYAVVSPTTFVQPIAMTALVVLVAVFYPAYKAAIIQPVEAMRHQ